jgi:mannose-6-phosphate isomerase-like protein (cupin superfamily)
MDVVSVARAFSDLKETWSPQVLADLNGQQVKAARLHGEFVWHSHAQEDEMFLVVRGELQMHFRDKVQVIGPGEFLVVPRGVEHKPVAPEEVEVLLFEPASTVRTGDA